MPETSFTLLWLAILLVAARVAAGVARVGQPPVLGELAVGIVLGNLGMAGIHGMEGAAVDPVLDWLAGLGVVVLMFQVALESDLAVLRRARGRAVAVAAVGVAVPVALGTFVAATGIVPGLTPQGRAFVGATLAATSVGITARVLHDLSELSHPASAIVMGAAVVDDVLGLLLLAAVSSFATHGAVDGAALAAVAGRAAAFFALVACALGAARAVRRASPLERLSSGALATFAIAFCFALSWAAAYAGLAALVGAFAAGMVVRAALQEPAPGALGTRDSALSRLDETIGPLGTLVVPVFFVFTGMQVRLTVLAESGAWLAVAALTAAAVAGKLAAGAVAGPGNRWRVAWGMVPRGEVGLVFAAAGRGLGVLPESAFAVVVLVVILTTLVTPPILGRIVRRERARRLA